MQPDPKQGERDYYAKIGAEGIAHSLRKPFSDENCAHYVSTMAALFTLLAPPPRRIVEFGCGTGWLSLFLGQRGYEVAGIDISADAIRHARAEAAARGITSVEFIAADYETFDGGARFDYAIFHDALHHAESELEALRCAFSALAEGGCVIASEPGSGHAASEAARDFVARFQVHEKSMPPSHIIRIAREAGFQRHLVLPPLHDLNRLLYRPGYQRARSQGELRTRWLLSIARSIRLLLQWRRDPGVVLLWK